MWYINGILGLVFLILMACAPEDGKQGKAGTNGLDGIGASPCTVSRVDGGVLIECGESQAIILDGKACKHKHGHSHGH